MKYTFLPWIFLITIWLANITDLIRGPHYYTTTAQIVFMNCLGAISLFVILKDSSNLNNTKVEE